MIKWLQEVMHGKEKKYQYSFQADYIIINLTMYFNNFKNFDEITKKRKVLIQDMSMSCKLNIFSLCGVSDIWFCLYNCQELNGSSIMLCDTCWI